MAVDTRDKRMSMIGFGDPCVQLMQNPTGTIGSAARAMLLSLYSGIALSAPPMFRVAWAKSANAITGPTMPVGTVIE